MAIIKCKMCGGDLNITEGMSVAECEYCLSKQTIPTADNEKKMTLFNRAGRLLRGCEFDKAAGVYESIVAEFPEEAEAYWGLLLCKYGIEYVDDPATGKKVPTCHRSSFDSVMDDQNLELALENTDAVARRVYREEAKAIEELRKGIIEVSSTEEPYDIFINYKETDENGDRTLDSVIAQDIYDALCDKGYRAFFSRISLEDKLGTEYEPYIFAALNSAKLMISVGTDYEHFNAVWVKNEWSRFLQLIAKGEKKTLIPCFKNIDAYDMPKEFAKLSAQDMGKVGAMQDLLRGVEKILGAKKVPAEEKRETVIVQQSNGGPNVQAMIDRGNMALEDNRWEDAAGFFNRALDMDAKCAEAYLGLFLASEKCSNAEQFVDTSAKELEHIEYENLQAGTEDHAHVRAAIKDFALQGYLGDKRIQDLFVGFNFSYKSCLSYIEAQYEKQQLFFTDRNYIRAEQFASDQLLATIHRMKASVLANAQKCLDEARAAEAATINRINEKYLQFVEQAESKAKTLYAQALAQRDAEYLAACTFGENAKSENEFFEAAKRFSAIRLKDYKDTAQFIQLYNQKGEELKNQRIAKENAEKARLAQLAAEEAERRRVLAAEEAERKRILAEKLKKEKQAKNKKRAIFAVIAAVIAVAAFLVVKTVVIPANEYKAAEALYAEEKYHEALAAFEALGGYKDADEKYLEISEQLAKEQADAEAAAEKAKAEAKVAAEKAEAERKAKSEAERLAKAEQLASTIAAGSSHSVGLKSDGTVVAVGDNLYGQCNVSGWTDIVAISAGRNHTVGLKSDGTVVAVGRSNNGQCMVDKWSDIVAICGGATHTIGLKSDGTVVSMGSHEDGEGKVSGWTDVVAISAGDRFSVGLRSDGKVLVTGKNKDGQLDAFRWTDIIAISAIYDHAVGLKSDGTVVAVGDNDWGQCDVDDWTDIVAISAGWQHTVGLKSDGTVVAVGRNDSGRCDVSGWTDIVAVSTGASNTFGLKSDGTVVAVGYNKDGQCDVSAWTNIKLPEAQ